MTKVIAIASSKGGVGKTTIATNLVCRLAALNKKVILCDANLGSPGVSMHLGLDNLPITLSDAFRRPSASHEALFHHPAGFHLIVPENYAGDSLSSHSSKLPDVILNLEGHAEYIILDTAAGNSDAATGAYLASDGAIVVTDMTPPSLVDAVRTIKHAQRNQCPVLGLVINRANTTSEKILEETSTLIGIPLLVTIPEHHRFVKALNNHRPVSLLYPHSSLARLFSELADFVIS